MITNVRFGSARFLFFSIMWVFILWRNMLIGLFVTNLNLKFRIRQLIIRFRTLILIIKRTTCTFLLNLVNQFFGISTLISCFSLIDYLLRMRLSTLINLILLFWAIIIITLLTTKLCWITQSRVISLTNSLILVNFRNIVLYLISLSSRKIWLRCLNVILNLTGILLLILNLVCRCYFSGSMRCIWHI